MQYHTVFIFLSKVFGDMWKYALFIMLCRALLMWHPFFSRLISHSHICSSNSKCFSPLLSHILRALYAILYSWRTSPLIHTRNYHSSFHAVLSFTLSDHLLYHMLSLWVFIYTCYIQYSMNYPGLLCSFSVSFLPPQECNALTAMSHLALYPWGPYLALSRDSNCAMDKWMSHTNIIIIQNETEMIFLTIDHPS